MPFQRQYSPQTRITFYFLKKHDVVKEKATHLCYLVLEFWSCADLLIVLRTSPFTWHLPFHVRSEVGVQLRHSTPDSATCLKTVLLGRCLLTGMLEPGSLSSGLTQYISLLLSIQGTAQNATAVNVDFLT